MKYNIKLTKNQHRYLQPRALPVHLAPLEAHFLQVIRVYPVLLPFLKSVITLMAIQTQRESKASAANKLAIFPIP